MNKIQIVAGAQLASRAGEGSGTIRERERERAKGQAHAPCGRALTDSAPAPRRDPSTVGGLTDHTPTIPLPASNYRNQPNDI